MVVSLQPPQVQYPPSDIFSDEPPLETDIHLAQIILLLTCLNWWWRERPDSPQRDDYYAAANMTIYYSSRQKRSEDFRGPDFFLVLGTEYKSRKSWVVWEEEGKYPNLIIEMLSETTAHVDRGEKKDIYQDIFRTPEYFWFDPYSLEFQGFVLHNGKYRDMVPNQQGWLWSEQLELYLGVVGEKLRFLTATGELVPTADEDAISEKRRADAEKRRADAAEAELERLRLQIQERSINLTDSD